MSVTLPYSFAPEHFYQPLLPKVNPILQLSIFLVIAWHVILGASRNGCSFILHMLQYLVQLCFMRVDCNLSAHDQKILSDFPTDSCSVEKVFGLEPTTIIYAVCPDDSCQATHPPKFVEGLPILIYPSRCRNRRFGRGCKTNLLHPHSIQGQVIYTPIKPFVFFSSIDWLGCLLSQPGIEAEMDRSWD